MGQIARYAGIAVAVLVLLAILVSRLVQVNRFRPLIESELSKTLGRNVKIGRLTLSILSGGASAAGFSISEDPSYGSGPFVSAKSMKIAVDVWLFLRKRRLNVTAITIEQPEISLRQSLSGDWNFSKLAADLSPAPASSRISGIELSITLVKIAGGDVSVKLSSCSNALRLTKVDMELRNFSSTSAFPFSLTAMVAGGGDVKLDGKAGPLHRADVALTPLDVNLKVSRLNLTGSGFVGPASGIAGLISFAGSAASNSQNLQIAGRLTAEQLKLARNGSPAARAAEMDFSLGHDLRTRIGALSRGDIHIGAAQGSLTGTYVIRGDAVNVNMNFYGPTMAVGDLAAMLPAVGITLPAGASFQGGAAGARLAVQGPADRLVATGGLAVNNTRLAGFDMTGKMSPVVRLAGIQTGPATDIQALTANLRMAPEGLTATNIHLTVPSIGAIAGAGTVSASHVLNFAMRANIQNAGGILGVLGPLGNVGNVPFFILGTASDPIFQPDMNGIANERIRTMQDMGNEAVKKASDIFGGLMDQLKPR
jgi:AsmA protein